MGRESCATHANARSRGFRGYFVWRVLLSDLQNDLPGPMVAEWKREDNASGEFSKDFLRACEIGKGSQRP